MDKNQHPGHGLNTQAGLGSEGSTHQAWCQGDQGRWQGEAWAKSSPEASSLCCGKSHAGKQVCAWAARVPVTSHQSPSMSSAAPGEIPPTCRKGGASRLTSAQSSISFRTSPCEPGRNPSLPPEGRAPSPSPGAKPKTELGGSLGSETSRGHWLSPPSCRGFQPPLAGAC